MQKFESFNELYLHYIKKINKQGKKSSPRGMKIKELIGESFILLNPNQSLCTLSSRKLNYKFATIERLEYISGVSNPDVLCIYNPNMKSYLNYNNTFDGAYGPRIGRQIEYIYNLLKKDKDTRQAIININSEVDKHETKDVPCTVSLQFFIRNNKLLLIVYMRSNDLLWGTPYDISAFCYIQMCLAYWLGIEVGYYQHFTGSLHYYLERENQLLKILENTKTNKEIMDIIDFPFEERTNHFNKFWDVEKLVREYRYILEEWVVNVPESLINNLKRIC